MSDRGSGDKRQNPPAKISYRRRNDKRPNRSSIPKKRPVDEKKNLEEVHKLVENFKMDATTCRKEASRQFHATNATIYSEYTINIGKLEQGIEKVQEQALEKSKKPDVMEKMKEEVEQDNKPRNKKDVKENVEKKVEQDVKPHNKKDVNENVEKKVEQDGKPAPKSKPNSRSN